MTHLTREQYDAAYYGDVRSDLKRRSGYSNYLELQTNWILKKRYNDFITKFNLKPTDKILELGSAVGYFGKVARENNLNVTCVDWSQWCYDNKCYDVTNEDALAFLKAQPDGTFDVIVSFSFIECLSDDQDKALNVEMERVAKRQIHVTNKAGNTAYYNIHTAEDWSHIFPTAEIAYYG